MVNRLMEGGNLSTCGSMVSSASSRMPYPKKGTNLYFKKKKCKPRIISKFGPGDAIGPETPVFSSKFESFGEVPLYQSKFKLDRLDSFRAKNARKGCSCKKSGCSKNYCPCFASKKGCGAQCGCKGCKNCHGTKAKNGKMNLISLIGKRS